MDALQSLRAPARLTSKLLGGAVGLATAPARAAIAVAELLVEDVLEALRSSPPPEDTFPPNGHTAGPDAVMTPSGRAAGPEAVTPSVARMPSAKRRRTRIREPRPPAALPELLDAPQEQPASENAPSDGSRTATEPPGAAAGDGAGAPAHLDTQEVLVAEFADPGSGDGAGAELHVDEPWDGYHAMRAGEVVDRLPVQDEASLSVLLLHERAHRARKSVISAAERELARRG